MNSFHSVNFNKVNSGKLSRISHECIWPLVLILNKYLIIMFENAGIIKKDKQYDIVIVEIDWLYGIFTF